MNKQLHFSTLAHLLMKRIVEQLNLLKTKAMKAKPKIFVPYWMPSMGIVPYSQKYALICLN